MKIAATIARYLLGFIFLVFGLNGFLQFLPQPPLAPGLATQYMTVLAASHYFVPVFALQFIGGALLLSNRFVPLALVILAPIIVNILLFHVLMAPAGMPPGVVVFVLWLTVFWRFRAAFAGILAMNEAAATNPAYNSELTASPRG